jgi:hypothetical protein
MRIAHLTTLSALTLVAGALAGCTTPINPDDLADRMALDAREVVHQSGGGVSFTQDSNSGLSKISNGLSGASSGVMGAMPSPVPPGMMSGMAGSSMSMSMSGMPSMLTTEEQFDSTADDLRVWLRQRVLADANLESKTDDSATYLLNGDPTCRQLPKDGDPPDVVPPLSSTCVDDLTKLQVRIVLTADGDGGRLTVLVGPDRLELSEFVIHSDLLAVEIDLAKAYAATQFIDQALGSSTPMSSRFDALSGRVRLAVHKDGEKKVTGSYSVLQAIEVGTLDSTGALGPKITMAASDPTFAVTGDGVNQTLTVKVAYGALDVFGTWNPAGTAAPNRDLHVAIGGIYGQTTFTEANDQIASTGVGIGETTIDVRSSRIFDLGLNPNDARRFDFTLSLDANNQPQVSLTPRFDLSAGYHLAAVASEYTSPPPSYTLDETYRVDLDNGGAAASFGAVPSSAGFGGGVRITAGTLTISTTSGAPSVVVPAGKCLTGLDAAPAGAHPVLGRLSVVDCP